MTGIPHDALLVASHIKSWKDSDPKTERTNPRSGLCLSHLYDKAFDAGLMTVDDEYKIKFSSSVLSSTTEEIAQKFFNCYEGKRLSLPDRFTPEQQFLNTTETTFLFHNMSVNSKTTESTCESCGASADEPWETDAVRHTVLRLSFEKPIHHELKDWRILCDECEEGLQQFHRMLG